MASPPIPLRVLVVEDSDDDADLNIRELKRGGYAPVVARVQSREEMRRALEEEEWDLVLSDFSLPGFSGPEALAEVRATGKDIPFILISGTIGEDAAVSAMKAGAGDYLVKGNLSRLLPAVARELRDAETRRQHRAAREELALQEERLRQSQKMEAVGRLAGGIAHDFNNMLTVMSGYADIALAELEPDHRVQESLKHIRSSVDKAAAITRQLLAFSRRQVMSARRFDLDQSVQDMARLLGPLIPENIRLHVPKAARPAPVHADPGQVQQVVLNLVLNARDALPKGGEIRLEVRPPGRRQKDGPEGPGPWVMLSVTDNGIGMDAETLAHVFEPFFTTKTADSSGGRAGTGLGLATVYGIVKQSGGHIRVASRPGEGTQFRIWLPASGEPEAAAGDPVETAAPDTRGSESILVAEDDDDLRTLIRRILEGQGYRVMDCADGEEAVKAFEAEPGTPLLIADRVLPGMDGGELAARLVRKSPGLRVLFISGYAESGQEADSPPSGGNGYLEKPFPPDRLLQAVRQALAARRNPADFYQVP